VTILALVVLTSGLVLIHFGLKNLEAMLATLSISSSASDALATQTSAAAAALKTGGTQ
jgi:hypothetical protein